MKHTQPTHHSKRKSQEGAAYAEALIVLPVFFVLLASVVLFNSMYSAKVEAMAKARRQVWIHSMTGDCGGSPAGCEGPNCTAEAEIYEEARETGGILEWIQGTVDATLDFLLLGEKQTAYGNQPAYSPPMFEGKGAMQNGRATVMCNNNATELDARDGIDKGSIEAGLP